jgi:hypothetical protein
LQEGLFFFLWFFLLLRFFFWLWLFLFLWLWLFFLVLQRFFFFLWQLVEQRVLFQLRLLFFQRQLWILGFLGLLLPLLRFRLQLAFGLLQLRVQLWQLPLVQITAAATLWPWKPLLRLPRRCFICIFRFFFPFFFRFLYTTNRQPLLDHAFSAQKNTALDAAVKSIPAPVLFLGCWGVIDRVCPPRSRVFWLGGLGFE